MKDEKATAPHQGQDTHQHDSVIRQLAFGQDSRKQSFLIVCNMRGEFQSSI